MPNTISASCGSVRREGFEREPFRSRILGGERRAKHDSERLCEGTSYFRYSSRATMSAP